jgi:hypothetical protein
MQNQRNHLTAWVQEGWGLADALRPEVATIASQRDNALKGA